MLKLVVFDCDGVMFSSREANRAYYNRLLEAFACPPMDEPELQYVHIHNVDNSVRHIFRRHTHIALEDVQRFRKQLDYTPYLQYMEMEPDLIAFLEMIKPRYHTAISTNRTDTMDTILETFQIRPWFDMVVTASVAPQPKPAPDGLFMIMNHFQVAADEVLYIGDSEIDREHCAAAKVDLVAFKNPELLARYHVDNFLSILALPPLRA